VTDFDFAVERIVVRGDRAAVAVALHGRGGHSGAPLLGYLSQLARVRNGAIAEARWFASAEEAEEALPGDRP
jgi:ketosteroid isomerase-like protein